MWLCLEGVGAETSETRKKQAIFFFTEMSQIPALPSHVRVIHEIRTESAYKEEASDARAEIEMELTA